MDRAKDRDGWIDFYEGAKDVYAHLDERLGPDPLPWEPWPDGEDQVPGGIRSHRLAKRTTLALQRAFLEGKLIAFFGDKNANRQIPSIAFADYQIALNAFTIGGLELDPLWPDEWQRFSGCRCHVETDRFVRWIASDDFADPRGLPELPDPWDKAAIPTRIATREPTSLSFVPLSEALSFMAFGMGLDKDRLRRALEWKLLSDGDSDRAIDALAEAAASLCDKASADPPLIRARGKYVSSYTGSDDGPVVDMPPIAFANYGRFDSMHDGLAAGKGTSYRPTPLSYVFDRTRHDGYREVQVHRAELMQHFPAIDEAPKTAAIAWVRFDLTEWMTFAECVTRARNSMGVSDDETAISTVINRGNDGLIRCSASRTELVLESDGAAPVRRDFDEWDAKRFSEMLHAAYHGSPCPAIQAAETLTLCNANFVTGDFKFLVECTNPPYRVFLFAWGMVFRRSDVEACFPLPTDAPKRTLFGIALGESAQPGDAFDPDAPADVAPWWTVLQAIGWIATRSRAYVVLMGELEAGREAEIARTIVFSSMQVYVARNNCACPARSLDAAQRLEACICIGNAGRSLLEAIRTKGVTAVQGTRKMEFYELAGVGQRPTCIDWLDINPAPTFSSAEVMTAFRPASLSDGPLRSPSVKAGKPPIDEDILAKADEMKARGLDGRTIAKEMRLEPGFENVATTMVRELIKGRWRPAGRPKKAA